MESPFNPAKGIHLGGSIVAIGASAIGIVTEAFGYRLFCVTLFMIGFAFDGTGTAMLAKQVFTADEWVVTASWVAFVVGGVFAASSSCIWQHSASLLTVAGAMLVVLNDAFGYMIYPSNHGVILALLCMMFGLLGGILALKLENPVLIVAPSLFGAGILVWGIGYFAGDFPNFTDLKDIATKQHERLHSRCLVRLPRRLRRALRLDHVHSVLQYFSRWLLPQTQRKSPPPRPA